MTTNDPLEKIKDACESASKMDYRFTASLSLPSGFRDGLYGVPPIRVIHPLAAVLWGEEGCSGDIAADAARTLGVEAAWVRGFADGFAQSGEQSADQEYVQGYLCGESLRTER